MSFEEGFEIGLSVGSPELDVDRMFMDFEKIQGATSGDEPDDAVPIVGRQLAQTVSGTIKDWLVGVL